MDYKDYKTGHTDSDFWFRAKNDLIDILMAKYFSKNKAIKILNLGVGTGSDLAILNKYGKNYVIDISKEALDVIPKNLCFEKKVADACKLPYKNDFFDVVVSFDVFEHIDDDKLAISEALRVLKKGGYLIFSVPAFQFLFSSHDKALEHKRRYDKEMLKKLFSKFSVSKIYYWNFVLFFPTACMRLIKKDSEAKIDNVSLPTFINNLFFYLLKIENRLIKYGLNPPVGLTFGGYCKK